VSSLAEYAGHCYGIETWDFSPTAQPNVDSGRGPGTFEGAKINCANTAVDPKDRNHFLYSKGGQYRLWESKDAGRTVQQVAANTKGVSAVPTLTRRHADTPTRRHADTPIVVTVRRLFKRPRTGALCRCTSL
jgi:hypothetical protein